jgi:hypothetical protein
MRLYMSALMHFAVGRLCMFQNASIGTHANMNVNSAAIPLDTTIAMTILITLLVVSTEKIRRY